MKGKCGGGDGIIQIKKKTMKMKMGTWKRKEQKKFKQNILELTKNNH